MGLTWNETFVLGIDEIDQQHHSIVEQFARFSQAVQEGTDREPLAEMADFLVDYAQKHFATEERYMLQFNYPDIEVQRQEHARFAQDAADLKKRIGEEGASREMALALTGQMVRWVIQHVRNHDRQMVTFILGEMQKQQQQH